MNRGFRNSHTRFKLTSLCVLILLSTSLFFACAVGGSDDDSNDDDLTRSEAVFSLSATTNDRGTATVSFRLAEGTSKFGITVSTTDSDYRLRFTEVLSGSGTDYLSPGRVEQVSLGDVFFAFVNAVNVPSRSEDPSVDDTQRFTVSAELIDASGAAVPGETLTFMVNSKVDPGLDAGTLRINLFFVGDVGQDQTTKDVTRAALSEFMTIFSNSARITINVEEIDIDGPVVLPLPLDGDDFYEAASGGAISPAVNIFVGGDIAGAGAASGVLGISADIPGPFHPSARSAVAASIFAGAGPDGIFSSEEVRILGETLAHEAAHFMGLFHPVDFDGSVASGTDPIDDTASCSFITECLSNDDLIRNLMFVSPVADGEGGFVGQNRLTDQQRAVLNRYIVVD